MPDAVVAGRRRVWMPGGLLILTFAVSSLAMVGQLLSAVLALAKRARLRLRVRNPHFGAGKRIGVSLSSM